MLIVTQGNSHPPMQQPWIKLKTSVLHDTLWKNCRKTSRLQFVGACITTCNTGRKSALLSSQNSTTNGFNMIPAQDTMSFNLRHDTALVKTKSEELLPLKALGSKSLDGLKMLLEYTFFLFIRSRGRLLVDLGCITLLLLRSIDRLILLLPAENDQFLVVENCG